MTFENLDLDAVCISTGAFSLPALPPSFPYDGEERLPLSAY
jgi:hypothetical protein